LRNCLGGNELVFLRFQLLQLPVRYGDGFSLACQ
jgi:hypothetical protein